MFASFTKSLISAFTPSSTPSSSSTKTTTTTTTIAPKRPPAKKTITTTLASLQSTHKLILFYGSQTGTAEDLASRTANEVYAKFGVEAVVADFEDYDMSDLITFSQNLDDGEEAGKVVIGFYLATYGEGEPTDNAADFYEWFMDGHGKGEDDDIEDIDDEIASEKQGTGINYIVFGLGNKTYEHYNSMGRRIARRLDSIGAKRVGAIGEGDDDGSMEDDFLAWKPKIIEALGTFYGVKDLGGKASRGLAHVPLFNVSIESSITDKAVFHGELSADHKPRRFQNGPGGEDKRQFVEISTKKRILYDAKNPLFSKIKTSYQLFGESSDEIKVSGTTITAGTPEHYAYAADGSVLKIQRQCVHVEFDISNTGIRYETGDHVGIYGSNSVAHVEELAKLLGLDDSGLDEIVKLKANTANRLSTMAKMPFPNPCSVRTALTHYLTINAPIKQHHLELIAKFASDETEKTAIYKLVDDRNLYVERVETPQKNLAEILRDFPSVKLPLDVLLGEILGPIVVRYYSISSSSKKEPQTVSITAVAVRYALPQKQLLHPDAPAHISFKEGLVTSYVCRLTEGKSGFVAPEIDASESYPSVPFNTHVPIFIRTSSFRLPRDASAPIIMIGPGTGVAPFRAFIQERVHVAASGLSKKPVGSTWLFYGCRHPDQDHLYKNELAQLLATAAAFDDEKKFDLRVHNAFSRVPGQPRQYVQNIVEAIGGEVYELLDKRRGYLYLCGDAKNMAADVNALLLKLAQTCGGKTEDEAKRWVKTLKTSGKFQEDVW
ncbi:hypothetical protein HK100_008493 [Physocladia obscura]|uniref:NADPH--hemoprotein reductase n=1 Tax=Physocladia obscura TaxID=109957 RepID=A0AAD5SPK2_9FUNG|nr:hypothetical protein HK100_008493 [Physocladia obscura]